MGDDKMKLLVHLCKKREFRENFKVILYSRNSTSLTSTLDAFSIPASYRDSIVMCQQPEGTAGVSSSVIRERILSGESCEDLLFHGVQDLLNKSMAVVPNQGTNQGSNEEVKQKNLEQSTIIQGLVGVTGFEPATSRPPAERATKLRHTPEQK